MWLLPLDFGGLKVEMEPGRYLLPWYHTPAQIARAAGLIGRLIVSLEHWVELPWEALPLPPGCALNQPERSLVTLIVPADVAPSEADARLASLGGRYQLVCFRRPRERGYSWQEKALQDAVLSLVRRNLARADHPLASLGVAALPLKQAARYCTDVTDLLDLLDEAVRHRLRYAGQGTGRADWLQSIRVVAGRALARRVNAVPSPLFEDALEVLLRQGAAVAEEVLACGGPALRDVGLAWVAAGHLSLGPLARRLSDETVRGQFLEALPAHRVPARLRSLLPETDSGVGRFVAGAASERAGRPARSGDALWREVAVALRARVARVGDGALSLSRAVDTVEELASLPRWAAASPQTGEAAVRLLRELDRAVLSDPEAARLRPALLSLLRFHARRGVEHRAERERACGALRLEISEASPAALRLALGATTAELGWDLAAAAADRIGLERVESLCEEALLLCPVGTATEAALLGVQAHLRANRGRPKEALALHRRRLAIYEALGARREAAVTEARVARLLASQGELDEALELHERTLETLTELGAEHDRAVTLGDIARILVTRRQVDRALALNEERLEILERLGATYSAAIARGDVARIFAAQGRLEEALALHEERLRQFTEMGLPQGRAIALGDVARIRASRGELDEALALQRERLGIFEALDDLDGIAVARLNIGQLEVRRGHVEAALLNLRTAFDLNVQVQHAEGIAASGAALAPLLTANGELEDARSIAEVAADRYDQLGQSERAAGLRAALLGAR